MRTNNGGKKIIVRKICRSFFFRVAIGILIFSALLLMDSATAQPSPNLILIGTESYTVSGNQFVRYRLAIANWNDFPNELFKSAPDLPPCGLNKNSSQTWVNIYDANNDKYIYGFCALSSSVHLTWIWFAVKQGLSPPANVYVVLDDRRTNTRYRSNTIQTSPIPTPKLSVTVSVAPNTVVQGTTSQVTVHVNTTGGVPVSYASVSVSATRGSFNPLSKPTDEYGDFKSTYIAPNVGASTPYTISASASSPSYISGFGSDTITVNPLPPLNISISKSHNPIFSGGTSQLIVHITTTGGVSVSGASVKVSVTGGSLSQINGLSDLNGDFNTTFTAPSVTTSTVYTISANASKSGFTNSSGVDPITVDPLSSTYIFQTTDNKIQIMIDGNYYDSPNYSYWADRKNHPIIVPKEKGDFPNKIFYKFVNWSGNSTSRDQEISIIAGVSPAGIYKAEYIIDKYFYLTIKTNCPSNCPGITIPGEGWYTNRTVKKLEAPSEAGLSFDSWHIVKRTVTDQNNSNPINLTIEENITAIANYNEPTGIIPRIINAIYEIPKNLIRTYDAIVSFFKQLLEPAKLLCIVIGRIYISK